MTQRARNAYVASICQLKASFDLFFAAQSIEVSSKDITTLNKRLQWQIDNHSRDLKYVKLDSTTLQLMIFTNSFFANNQNLFSQIDYVIYLVDSKYVNIVHWSSIKCKRVTRSVLAAELYALAHDFDFDVALKATLSAISIDSYFSFCALISNHCTTVSSSSIRFRRNVSWLMSWTCDNRTSDERSRRLNEYTTLTIRSISWSKAKRSRFWKRWLISTRSTWTSANELND